MRLILGNKEHFYLGPYKVGFRILPSTTNPLNSPQVELIVHSPCYSQTNSPQDVPSAKAMGAIMTKPGTVQMEPVKLIPLIPFNTFQGYYIRVVNHQFTSLQNQTIELEILMPSEQKTILDSHSTSTTTGNISTSTTTPTFTSTGNVSTNTSTSTRSIPIITNTNTINTFTSTNTQTYFSISDVLRKTEQHQILLSLLQKTNLISELEQNKTTFYTIFAPTDLAFRNSGLLTNNNTTLRQILLYHVLPRKLSFEEIKDNWYVPTLANELVDFHNISTSITYNNRSPATYQIQHATINYSMSNLMATNAIIHSIDQVLIPPSLKMNTSTQVQNTHTSTNTQVQRTNTSTTNTNTNTSFPVPLVNRQHLYYMNPSRYEENDSSDSEDEEDEYNSV